MDALSFIAAIVASLAWPTVVVVGIFAMRKELPRLAESLRKLKFKDFEAEFDRSVKEVRQEASVVIPEHTKQLSDGRESALRELAKVADVAPRAGILEAWLTLESAAVDSLAKIGEVDGSVKQSLLRVGEALKAHGILNGDQWKLFIELRELRNRAVHISSEEITIVTAIAYIGAALKLAAFLKSWEKEV